ncbi:MAG: histidine kinase [Bacteroidetes bacterium]|nr:histidine kinase [Bacteroidota bacterium]
MRTASCLLICFTVFLLKPSAAQQYDADSLPPQWEVSNDYFARFSDFLPIDFNDIGTVSDIIQDRTGFIWLAGDKGLGRFDGYEFRIYRADDRQGSLNGDLISSLQIDDDGKLWVSHSGGIAFYDKFSDSFSSVYGAYTPFGSYHDSIYVRAMHIDADTLIWFETVDGWLNSYHINSKEIKRYSKHLPVYQPYYRYHTITRSKAGELYIGGRGVGPLIFDEENNTFISLKTNKSDIPGYKRENDVSLILPFNNTQTWIGGLEGLYLYDRQQDYFYKYFKGTVYDMIADKQGNYWLGTGQGIYQIELESGQILHYQLDNNDPGSIGGERIFDIYEDRSGRFWFAHENGVSTHLPNNQGVKYFFHIPGIDNTPASTRITSLAQKSANEIWIGTADEGLDVLDLRNLTFKHFNPENNDQIVSQHIRSLATHPDGSLYIGYWAGRGFGRYLPEKDIFEQFRYDNSGFSQDWYNDFEFDKKGNAFLGFWGGPGLTLFDHKKADFAQPLAGKLPNPYQSRLITGLEMKVDNHLWISTSHSAVIFYDYEADTARSYYSEINPEGGIEEELINDIVIDNNGIVWACAKGLYRYKPEKDRFIKVKLGLYAQHLEIYKMLVNSANSLWLLTSKGLMKYDQQNDWVTDYSMLVNIEFNEKQAAIMQLDTNQLIIGGSNGLALLQIDKVGLQHAFPKVFLTHLDVFNEVYIPFISNIEVVNLNYNQNFFTINFGTDRWEMNRLYTYYYMLEGFDNEWRSLSSNQKSVYFTNVPAGSYHFKMRTGDIYGNMGEQEADLVINVDGPLWLRWWFLLLVFVLLVTLIGLLWMIRLRDVKMKLLNMELNQKLLRLQMNPHFIFNSLTSIQNYIYSNQTHLAGQYLSDFARLIRLILENSRHEKINLAKEIETISLYMELQQLRFTKEFKFEVIVDPAIDTEVTFVPPMMVQPFLENALEHGLKNKLQGDGSIEVRYSLFKNKLQYEVRDNGIGLTAAARHSKLHDGESLSIAICRERLQLIEKQSNISITFTIEELKEDDTVKGTRVLFSVPLTGKFVRKSDEL